MTATVTKGLFVANYQIRFKTVDALIMYVHGSSEDTTIPLGSVVLREMLTHHVIIIIWFVRLLPLRPLLAYCASLG
jgi:hypothetical protein